MRSNKMPSRVEMTGMMTETTEHLLKSCDQVLYETMWNMRIDQKSIGKPGILGPALAHVIGPRPESGPGYYDLEEL